MRVQASDMKELWAGKRVLVAEDNPLVAMDIEDTLLAVGAQVVGPVAAAADAVSRCLNGPLDAAILDFNLHGGPVTPVLEILWERSVPMVICTGAGLPQEVSSRFPGLRVCLKPVVPETLLTRLSEAHEAVMAGR